MHCKASISRPMRPATLTNFWFFVSGWALRCVGSFSDSVASRTQSYDLAVCRVLGSGPAAPADEGEETASSFRASPNCFEAFPMSELEV